MLTPTAPLYRPPLALEPPPVYDPALQYVTKNLKPPRKPVVHLKIFFQPH
jgi:hypothetical protein